LKASLGDAVKQNQSFKHEQVERHTVLDPIPAFLVCALSDGPLNLAAAHGRHTKIDTSIQKALDIPHGWRSLRVTASMTTHHWNGSAFRPGKAREGYLGAVPERYNA
jgi:hypothetical protein